jgi:hypothetical protein
MQSKNGGVSAWEPAGSGLWLEVSSSSRRTKLEMLSLNYVCFPSRLDLEYGISTVTSLLFN